MIKGICLALILAVSVTCFSQPVVSPAPEVKKTDYMTKGLRQRHTANAMFWGGFAVVVTGGAISFNNNYGGFLGGRNNKKYNHSGDIIAITGLASMVGSIPLFVSYHNNKRKARSLSIKNEPVQVLSSYGFATQPVPSLSFKLDL